MKSCVGNPSGHWEGGPPAPAEEIHKADYFNEQLPRVTTPQPEAGLG